MVVLTSVFVASGVRAVDLGDYVLNVAKSMPHNSGHTASTILNPEGRGDVLIFPYYDVREVNGKSQDFMFGIINEEIDCPAGTAQCPKGMAVKLRFREWAKGEETLDVDIWVSSGDVWFGALTHNTSLASPYGARITSPDWVIIDSSSDTFTLAKALNGGLDFPTTALVPSGSSNLMGYLEAIGEERTYDKAFQESSSSSFKVSRVKSTCKIGTFCLTDAPNTLMGFGYIVRVAEGSSFAYNAKAVANFSRNQGSLFSYPGSTTPTLINCEDSLDQFEFQIAQKETLAAYSIEEAIDAKFSLILTFPTKHYHFCSKPNYTVKGDATAPCAATYPLGPPWTVKHANASETINLTILDRNENRFDPSVCIFSVCPAPPGLHWEVNVIGLYQGTPPTVPVAQNRDNVAFSTSGSAGTFDSGYIVVKFPNTGHVQSLNPEITKFLDRDVFLSSYGGLPVLGLALQEFSNGNVGGFYGEIRDAFYKVDWTR
jgi:hypothetical protein